MSLIRGPNWPSQEPFHLPKRKKSGLDALPSDRKPEALRGERGGRSLPLETRLAPFSPGDVERWATQSIVKLTEVRCYLEKVSLQ